MRGSVRKPRTDGGAWSYRIDSGLDDRDRRRQREVGGFRTKKDAQTALNEALADTQRGTYSPPSRTTVREFLAEWHEGARHELALTALEPHRQQPSCGDSRAEGGGERDGRLDGGAGA